MDANALKNINANTFNFRQIKHIELVHVPTLSDDILIDDVFPTLDDVEEELRCTLNSCKSYQKTFANKVTYRRHIK